MSFHPVPPADPAVCTIGTPLDPAACYRALEARDARFDGQFFTGVTSTGIYCRPVCRVRTPRRENCRFFALPAQAEAAGFRPCLRCRPEVAPPAATQPAWSTHDASAILARQAAGLLDAAVAGREDIASMAALAQRLGVSERHLRRIFDATWGISPLQYLQTHRLLLAKQLLTDTQLPVANVAALSGFISQRRFNAAFAKHYRLQPRALRNIAWAGSGARRTAASTNPGANLGIRLRLAYRPPYDVAAMLGFLHRRAIPGVEWVDGEHRRYARTLHIATATGALQGWIGIRFEPQQHQVLVELSDTLVAALPLLPSRVREWLDLDADPGAIARVLDPDFAGQEGVRVPGTLDGFELAVRAILGQQITVAAARTLACRLVDRFGTTVQTPWPQLSRCFPGALALAQARPDELGELGIVRQRQSAIMALARACSEGGLQLEPGVDVQRTIEALQALPGIGPWTAGYIALRALRWPDTFLAGDVALQLRLGLRQAPQAAQRAEQASQAWRPWRSYAVLRLWDAAERPEPQPAP